METNPGRVRLDRAGKMWSKLGDLRFPQGSDIVVGINKMEEDITRYQKMAGENLSDTIKRGILMKALANETELQKHVFRNSTRLDTYAKMRQEVMSALTAERAVHADGRRSDGNRCCRQERQERKRQERQWQERSERWRKGTRPRERHWDPESPCGSRMLLLSSQGPHKRGVQISYRRREGQQIQGRERQEKGQTVKAEGKETSECVGREPRNVRQQQQSRRGSTVGALQARMIIAVRATHGTTTNSSETADGDIPERVRLAPLRNALMLDSGAQVSAVPRQQIDELHYNPGPSNVTGLKGISGEDIPRYGHVELNLRRGQDVVQVGAEVADIGHGIIATDAIVKRGRSVLYSPAGHWIVDGTLEPPSQTTAIKLRTHQANYYLEFDEILKQDETNQGQSVAAMRRGYRTRQPAEASQGTLPRTMGLESDEQTTLPTRALKSPGQPSVEEKTAHEMHHLPYRPWCPECVEARGVDDPHHRQPALDELATPEVMFDIFFVGPDEMAKKYKIANGCFNLRDKERFLSSH